MGKIKYKATCIVHWSTGPVYACDYHARVLMVISNMLGGHIVRTKLDKEAECPNCVNEAGTEAEEARLEFEKQTTTKESENK